MAIASTRPTTKAFTYREITLQDRLREVAREVGDKPALLMGDRSVSFREVDQLSDRLAAALAKRGVRPGDRVTIFMPNSIEFVIAFYGALKAGGVVNPINAQSKEREVRFQVDDSGAKAVLVHEALWPVVEPIKAELAGARVLARTGPALRCGFPGRDGLAQKEFIVGQTQHPAGLRQHGQHARRVGGPRSDRRIEPEQIDGSAGEVKLKAVSGG